MSVIKCGGGEVMLEKETVPLVLSISQELRVEIQSQEHSTGKRAGMRIFHGNQLMLEVEGRIVMEKGPQGREYPTIHLFRVKP
jgi:hypothetical protein